MTGYAVVDTETTGVKTGYQNRICEVAVVLLDPEGRVEDQWVSLINPMRDLGAQRIHGITAKEARMAPTFDQIAGKLASLLAGRLFVAHGESFDRRFLVEEFNRAGWDVPMSPETSYCTLRGAKQTFGLKGGSLEECCEFLSIDPGTPHHALDDATAAAGVLQAIGTVWLQNPRTALSGRLPWTDQLSSAAWTPWPIIPDSGTQPVLRSQATALQTPTSSFISYLDTGAGAVEQSVEDAYLVQVERAMLDLVLSAGEKQTLIQFAASHGIGQAQALEIHQRYLDAIVQIALEDDVITSDERAQIDTVAGLLGLGRQGAINALNRAGVTTGPNQPAAAVDETSPEIDLKAGDMVVFTGDMTRPRESWKTIAQAHGFTPHDSVTKKVTLVVAADTDSMSGKANKARQYGIPIVSEQTFANYIGTLNC
jgi:DNA polymerase-3 subunit epsilon